MVVPTIDKPWFSTGEILVAGLFQPFHLGVSNNFYRSSMSQLPLDALLDQTNSRESCDMPGAVCWPNARCIELAPSDSLPTRQPIGRCVMCQESSVRPMCGVLSQLPPAHCRIRRPAEHCVTHIDPSVGPTCGALSQLSPVHHQIRRPVGRYVTCEEPSIGPTRGALGQLHSNTSTDQAIAWALRHVLGAICWPNARHTEPARSSTSPDQAIGWAWHDMCGVIRWPNVRASSTSSDQRG